MESLPRIKTVAAAAGLACAALLVALLGGSDAQGKGGGGAVVTSTAQSAIVDAGALSAEGGKGRVKIFAIGANGNLGKVSSYKAKQGKSGKTRSAAAARVHTATLNETGVKLVKGCSVDGFNAVTKARKGGKSRSRYTALNRDLAVCSTGSENPTARPYKGDQIPTANSDRCDFLDPAVCLQPWPNDYFTVADGTTDTGRRLALNQQSMPKNKNGTPIGNTEYNRADGFSPGNSIIIKIPQVQTQAAFNNSGIVPISDLRKYDDDNQAVVVIDADTGERQPIWAEVDANPLVPGKSGNPANSNLIIRPARNYEEGHRYIVAIRNLRDAQNQPVDPPMPFRVYRDRLITSQAPVESRRAHMESLMATLQANGFSRSNLYMTWDFTVASEDSLTGRALAMRDDALTRLGDTSPGDPVTGTGDTTPGDGVVDGDAPSFVITGTSDPDGPGGNVLRQVDGMLTNVPCYLDTPGCPPVVSQFAFAPGADDPTLAPTSFADDGSGGVNFRCIIPSSVDGGTEVVKAKPGVYGHGLLGDYSEVGGTARLANQGNSIWCATNWAGFSEDDVGGVSNSLVDLSNFHLLVDRMQQGFINFIYLGRALDNPNGFAADDAFKVDADDSSTLDSDESVIDTSHLYYEGISQGAVMGGAITALSPDFTRSVLNVPGMNYGNLLRRSVDFDEYAELPSVGLYAFYPNELERPLVLSMMQLLWDRSETNGYAHHITTDPLPNTPQHQVLLQLAAGDHQVANSTAEVEARTIGARVYQPALDPGRHWDANPFMQLPGIDFGSGPSFTPYHGSALVYYDGGPTSWFNNGATPSAALECNHGNPATNPCQGSGVAPNEEVPPRPENGFGADPHSYPRRSVDGLQHIIDFLQPNGYILPCTDPGPVIRPCYANGWTGP